MAHARGVRRPARPAAALLQRSVAEVYPEAVFAPYLVPGVTDARNYGPLSDSVYRFSPSPLSLADLARIHGTDERIAVGDYARLIGFYARLVENATSHVE